MDATKDLFPDCASHDTVNAPNADRFQHCCVVSMRTIPIDIKSSGKFYA